jgi:hypothetical protein
MTDSQSRSRVILGVAALLYLSLVSPDIQAATFNVHHATEEKTSYTDIEVSGIIDPGDTEKFKATFKPSQANFQSIGDEQSVRVFLDSPGGSYIEGILLGEEFHQVGLGIYIRSGAECFSACAMAFLGGTFLGASAGWGPNRHLDLGGKLGFHSFYLDSGGMGLPPDKAVDIGKVLALLAVGYAKTLNIDMDFIIRSLTTHADDILLINNVGLLRSLQIEVAGAEPLRTVTEQSAVNLCNYATDWKRPVNLLNIFKSADPLTARGGASPAVIDYMTLEDLKRRMFGKISSETYLKGPITDLIRTALKSADAGKLPQLYDDATKLDILPSVDGDGRVVHVSGFDYGHGFWVSDCYLIPRGERSDDLEVDVILQGLFVRPFKKIHFSRTGSVIYEMFKPDAILVPAINRPSAHAAENVVRTFYAALGIGDGAAASALVIPEKRAKGPLSAKELTDFYSHLVKPLRIVEINSAGRNLFSVKYNYTRAGGHVCDGKSLVGVATRGESIFIEKIQSQSGC